MSRFISDLDINERYFRRKTINLTRFTRVFTIILQQFTLLYYYIMLTYLHFLPDGADHFYSILQLMGKFCYERQEIARNINENENQEFSSHNASC